MLCHAIYSKIFEVALFKMKYCFFLFSFIIRWKYAWYLTVEECFRKHFVKVIWIDLLWWTWCHHHLYGKHWYYNTFVYILLILSPYSKLFFILERKNKLPRNPPFLPIRWEDMDLLKLCVFWRFHIKGLMKFNSCSFFMSYEMKVL